MRKKIKKFFGLLKRNLRPINLGALWFLRGILLAIFLIQFIENIFHQLPIPSKGILITLALSIYFWFLWQFDHSIAPIVWEYKDKIFLDGWIFEDFLNWLGKKYFDNPEMGTEFFEITSVYNTCMVFLIIMPIIIACLGFL